MATSSSFFHLHAHSMYSVLDGMPSVPDLVKQVKRHGQPGIGLTDHGVMSGAVELYAEAREAGIKPFPGEEFYVVRDVSDKDSKRYHLGLLSMSNKGYQGLLDLTSASHDRARYHYRPRVDLADLAKMASDPSVADGVICLTGCWFGLLQQSILEARLAPQGSDKFAIQVGVRTVEMLRGWFPNTFIEVQAHDIGRQDGITEQEMIDLLAEVSYLTGVPMVATQDSHYLNIRDKKVHDMMKRIAYIGSDDASFPGDSYHLSTGEWVRDHHTPQVWESTLDVCQELLDRHTLTIPELDNYTYHIPQLGKSDKGWLRTMCRLKLSDGAYDKEYQDRVQYELGIIETLGMSGYFRLIYEGVRFAQKNSIYVRARGSANGSLVCYLLGITAVDPIKWGLNFERFLSPDRKKPPDIDLDIEDMRRDEVIDFYRKRFQVVGIGTFSNLGQNEFGRGSTLVQYLSQKRRELGDNFKEEMGHIKYMDDVPEKDRVLLERLSEFRVKKAAGAHAAGFVVGTKARPIHKQIPTMLIPSSGTTVTQFTMDEVERLGYIKIDLLGQRTLSTIKRCLAYIGQSDLDWIPDDDKHTMHQLRMGKTDGVFQLEGWTAAAGCREMKVKTTEDIIRVNALYRPATISSGYKDLYLHNRRNPRQIHYPPHPAFPRHLKNTYGVAIFQEQVMNILRDMGVPYEELNAFLSALKMSNDKAVKARRIFKEHRERFLALLINDGMSKVDARECWETISGFAGYGFNRAHACAYGVLGYQAAYLKTHYPLEFMASLLETNSGTPKEDGYVDEAKRLGIIIYGADVNRSGVVWRLDKDGIRRGLLSIKGVGQRAAEAIVDAAPYDSIEDLIERTDARAVTGGKSWAKSSTLNGVLEALRKGGALRSINIDPY